MKKLCLIFCFCFLARATYAQYVTISDTAFVGWLTNNGFAACMNDNQLDTTCPAVLNATSITCNITSIQNLDGVQYFKGLTELTCINGKLAIIPSFPSHLMAITCDGNFLHNLPPLPTTLLTLSCGSNPLGSLPTLPTGLISLRCAEDSLTSLPNLPSGLQNLTCGFNSISSLPDLPVGLQYLSCQSNPLHTLPVLPNSITFLQCIADSLTSLPELPDSLGFFSCSNNPKLQCMPELKKIVTLYFEYTGISCLFNYGTVTTSYPSLASVSLCTAGNSNSCSVSTTVREPTRSNVSLKVYPNPTSNTLHILESELFNQPGRLEIFNTVGQVVFETKNLQQEINVSHLSPGMYFLVAQVEEGRWIQKFIKE